jgi:hypothetical protein
MIENRVFTRIFGLNSDRKLEKTAYIMSSSILCTLHKMFFRVIKSRRIRW